MLYKYFKIDINIFIEVKVALLRYNKSSTTGYTVDDFMQDNNFKQKIESSKCMFQLADSNTIRTNQLGHAFTFFTPPQSGVYKFLMNCSGFCRLYVSTPGKQDRKILADTKSGYINFFNKTFHQPRNFLKNHNC